MAGYASTHLLQALLDHDYGLATYTPADPKYFGLHLASTLASAASSGDGSISMTDEPTVGRKLVISVTETEKETHYVEAVSGTGPYTVDIEDANGTSSTLTNNHDSGAYVEFAPDPAGSDYLEPDEGEYARISKTNDSTEFSRSGLTVDNDNEWTWAKAQSDWGMVTHVLAFDASTGGNLLWVHDGISPNEITTNDTPTVAAGDLDTIGSN